MANLETIPDKCAMDNLPQSDGYIRLMTEPGIPLSELKASQCAPWPDNVRIIADATCYFAGCSVNTPTTVMSPIIGAIVQLETTPPERGGAGE